MRKRTPKPPPEFGVQYRRPWWLDGEWNNWGGYNSEQEAKEMSDQMNREQGKDGSVFVVAINGHRIDQ